MDSSLTTTANYALSISPGLPLDQNPAAVFLGSVKGNSRRVYRGDLDTIAGLLTGYSNALDCSWAALRYQHTAAIRARLSELVSSATGKPLAPATINRMLCALRGVLKTAWRLGQMGAEDYQRAIDINSVIGETLPAGRGLASGEITAIMAACENDLSSAGVRDAGLIASMYPGGLRRAEVVSLDFRDYNPDSGALTVRHGKRNKARTTYLSNGAKQAMADWLAIRGSVPGPLFWPVNKGGKLQPRRMTAQAVYNILQKRGQQAKVKGFTPHDLRRTFVSDMLDSGADIATVAGMAGHSSVNTTQRYDRRPEAAKQKAAGLLHLPYHGRLIS